MPPLAKTLPDFAGAFAALKAILVPYAGRLMVTEDRPGSYSLYTRSASYRGERLYFGGVAQRKTYVSFYLMPVSIWPELQDNMSIGLKHRMQGKSCFNLKTPDQAIIAELKSLAEAGFARVEAGGYL